MQYRGAPYQDAIQAIVGGAPVDFTGCAPVAPVSRVARTFRRVPPRVAMGQDGGAMLACQTHLGGVSSPAELDDASLRAHVEGLEVQLAEVDQELRDEHAATRAAAQESADEFAAFIAGITEQLRPYGSECVLALGQDATALNRQIDTVLNTLTNASRFKSSEVRQITREQVPGSISVALRLARAELEKREKARAARLATLKADMAELGIEV